LSSLKGGALFTNQTKSFLCASSLSHFSARRARGKKFLTLTPKKPTTRLILTAASDCRLPTDD